MADYRSVAGPAGVAVRSALMAAEDPGYAATALLRSLRADDDHASAWADVYATLTRFALAGAERQRATSATA